MKTSVRASRLQRASTALLATITTIGTVAVQPAAAAIEAPIPSAGFRDDTVISGLTLPTTIKFAPNGDIFVAEKSGLIKRFTSLADTNPDITANLQTDVMNFFDRGLLGLAVDPQYPQRPYIYALYSRDALIGGTSPKWGSAGNGGNDTCRGAPNGPGPNVDGCTGSGRLLRLTVGPNGLATGQKVLVDDWCVQFPSHSIGTVAFGPDGYLYAGGGDGASYSATTLDYGQLGGTIINPDTGQPYTPRNPCGDPPGGVGGSMTLPTAQGGSLRTQDKRTTSDPTALNGTIIRIDPDTGLAAPSNPSYASGRDENDRRIIAFGLRNPYRFTFRPGTNEVWIGDVGAETWEEFDRIVSPTNPVRNFGWPCYEGTGHQTNWDALNVNICENLYAAGSTAVKKPYWSYNHLTKTFSGDPCPSSGGVISGVAFYTGSSYPSRFKNALFFTDYGRQCIWAIKPGTNGLPDPTRIEVVDQIADGPVDLVTGPGGDIFYVDHVGGTIHRLVYTSGNQPPVVVATADPTNGPAPLTVQFDASASTDPNGNSITFAWDLDADGAFDDAFTAKTQRIYTLGTWLPAVKVTDSKGASSVKGFVISAGNSAPTPVIDTPGDGFQWTAGEQVNFSGHANDPDEGALPAASLSWRVILHHCTGPAPTDCHQHVIQDFDGTAADSFETPDHELPAHLELRLTATDSGGLSTTTSLQLDPQVVNLTFATNPTGMTVTAGSVTQTTSFSQPYIVDGSLTLNAPADQVKNDQYYVFSGWSDGGGRIHTINAPASPTTYTATYSPSTPADAPNTCATATGSQVKGRQLFNTLSSTSDEDWFKYNLASDTWTMITLAGLSANLRMDLYSACGTLLASSDRSGTSFEELYLRLTAGSYWVRVRYVSGTLNTGAVYGMIFNALGDGVYLLSSSTFTSPSTGKQVVIGEVLNNNDIREEFVQVMATFYNANGGILTRASALVYVDVMPARSRSPYRISIPKPAGYHHFSVALASVNPSVEPIVGKLNVTSSSVVTNPGPQFKGSFKNGNSYGIKGANSIVTLYNKWAIVINARSDATSPSSMAAGATASYSSTFGENYTGWNRGLVILEAKRK